MLPVLTPVAANLFARQAFTHNNCTRRNTTTTEGLEHTTMKKLWNAAATLALLLATGPWLGGCTCGFDCSSDDDDEAAPVLLTLRFGAGQIEPIKEVVLSIDRIELRGSAGTLLTVDNFTIPSLQANGDGVFAVDLLTLDAASGVAVFTDQAFAPGFVTSIDIYLDSTAPDDSYVLDENDQRLPLAVTDNRLRISGREFLAGERDFAIDFHLASALRRNASNSYRLEADQFRLVNADLSGTITGTVDPDLFETTADCEEKSEPTEGNRVYLYEGTLTADALGELQSGGDNTPYSVAVPMGSGDNWRYTFGFIPTGDYTLAFACDAQDDDAQDVDNIVIPQPGDQVVSRTLDNSGDTVFCDFEPDTVCPAE